MFIDLTQNPTGISYCDNIGRNVFGHNASGSDDAVVPNADSGQYDDTCAQPAVFHDVNRHIIFIGFLAKFRQNGVSRCGKNDIRSEHGIIADKDVGIVHCGKIKVCVDAFSEMDVFSSPVGVKRRFDITAFSDLSNISRSIACLFCCSQGLVLL